MIRNSLVGAVAPRDEAMARVGRDAARHVVADVGARLPPTVDDAPWWPFLAVQAWLSHASRCGLAAEDCTYEVIDHHRDGDLAYGGSVRVGTAVLDLLVDSEGCVRVAPEYRYLR